MTDDQLEALMERRNGVGIVYLTETEMHSIIDRLNAAEAVCYVANVRAVNAVPGWAPELRQTLDAWRKAKGE